MTDFIKIKVSNETFYVSTTTLLGKEQTLLGRLMNRSDGGDKDTLIFDRSVEIFKDIILWYTTSYLRKTPGYHDGILVSEYDFWGIPVQQLSQITLDYLGLEESKIHDEVTNFVRLFLSSNPELEVPMQDETLFHLCKCPIVKRETFELYKLSKKVNGTFLEKYAHFILPFLENTQIDDNLETWITHTKLLSNLETRNLIQWQFARFGFECKIQNVNYQPFEVIPYPYTNVSIFPFEAKVETPTIYYNVFVCLRIKTF
jgi:K+ channel tetramerisation domain.